MLSAPTNFGHLAGQRTSPGIRPKRSTISCKSMAVQVMTVPKDSQYSIAKYQADRDQTPQSNQIAYQDPVLLCDTAERRVLATRWTIRLKTTQLVRLKTGLDTPTPARITSQYISIEQDRRRVLPLVSHTWLKSSDESLHPHCRIAVTSCFLNIQAETIPKRRHVAQQPQSPSAARTFYLPTAVSVRPLHLARG